MRTPIAAIAIVLALSLAALATAQNPNDLWESGSTKMSRGDMTGAIQDYENLAAKFSCSELLVGRALLKLGEWYELSGQNAEKSHRAYQRVIDECKDPATRAEAQRRVAVAQDSSTLSGIVITAGTGEPVDKARVELRLPGGDPRNWGTPQWKSWEITTADRAGKFSFPNIAPGQYQLAAARAGYTSDERAGGSLAVITVVTGKSNGAVRLVLMPGGAISGRITKDGKPAAQLNVDAWSALTYDGCQHSFTRVLSALTNNLGEYDLSWLPPGRYYIAVKLSGSAEPGASAEAPTYAPNSVDWRAANVIDLRPGAKIQNVHVAIQPPPPTRHVRGVVKDSEGRRVSATLRFVPLGPGAQLEGRTERDGSFDMLLPAPGIYSIHVDSPAVSPPLDGVTADPTSGTAEVDVSHGDINGVTVTLKNVLHLAGRVSIQNPPAGFSSGASGLSLTFRPDPCVPGAPAYAVQHGDGSRPFSPARFTNASPVAPTAHFSDLPISAGRYRVLVEPLMTLPGVERTKIKDDIFRNAFLALQNAYVTSIKMGGIDVLNDGLDLTTQPSEPIIIEVGNRPGTLKGVALNDRRQPVRGARVALIPEGGVRFHVHHATTLADANGQFEFGFVPPGDYKIFAWDGIEEGSWLNPDVMRSYEPNGTPVRLGEDEKKSGVRVTVAPRK